MLKIINVLLALEEIERNTIEEILKQLAQKYPQYFKEEEGVFSFGSYHGLYEECFCPLINFYIANNGDEAWTLLKKQKFQVIFLGCMLWHSGFKIPVL